MTNNKRKETPPWAAGTSNRMHELDPVLADDELSIIKSYGEIKQYKPGDILWSAGQRARFFAVLEGHLEIFRCEDGEEHEIIVHGPGHYPGEIITMSNGRALVSGRAKDALKVIAVDAEDLRRLISTESDLGEKILHSFIIRRMRMIEENLANVRLLGNADTKTTSSIESFLSRSGVPYTVIDPDRDVTVLKNLLKKYGLSPSDLPVVISNGEAMAKPSNRLIAETLGFSAEFESGAVYDVVIAGSGPGGLAAAVYAASEGLSVLVLESCAVGGQAGSSSKIENYMGFPTGISGQALTGRGYLQAQKFGAHVAVARELQHFECGDALHRLRVDGGDEVFAKAVVVATGAIYRQPELDRLESLGGIHYGASHLEGQLCRDRDIAIVGGGNSAGQAAVYLSKRAKTVNILIRGESLASSMSDYLIQRINNTANIKVNNYTEISALEGEESLTALRLKVRGKENLARMELGHLFLFIGAIPSTQFVQNQFALDERGFVLTGDDLDKAALQKYGWPLERKPSQLETSCPRVFAVGDVRANSVKRVASAVGEGSVCIQAVHRAISELEEN